MADRDIPDEAGKRASVDPVTHEARGSGAGAGGGVPGEDYDADRKGGGGYPRTGADGEAEVAGDEAGR